MKSSEPSNNKSYFVQTLDRALDVLECFTYGSRELDMPHIIKATGFNRTTARRLVNHLLSREYLAYNPERRTYRLGIKLFRLGGIVMSSFSLRKVASPHLTKLRDDTGMAVFLGTLHNEQILYLDKRESTGLIRITSDIGTLKPIHFAMLGPVLMADMPRELQEDILDRYPLVRYTPHTITDREAFSLELARIRDQGYFLENKGFLDGFIGIGAPIRDYTRNTVAALGIAVPEDLMEPPDERKRFISGVCGTAGLISKELGYLSV